MEVQEGTTTAFTTPAMAIIGLEDGEEEHEHERST